MGENEGAVGEKARFPGERDRGPLGLLKDEEGMAFDDVVDVDGGAHS